MVNRTEDTSAWPGIGDWGLAATTLSEPQMVSRNPASQAWEEGGEKRERKQNEGQGKWSDPESPIF